MLHCKWSNFLDKVFLYQTQVAFEDVVKNVCECFWDMNLLYLSFTLEGCSILRNFEFGKTKGKKKGGPYKRTQTAALWQAKFYLPHQAVAPQHIYCGAAVHLLWHHSRQAAVDETPSSNAACLLRQYTSCSTWNTLFCVLRQLRRRPRSATVWVLLYSPEERF